jgi:hypothetical protein
VIDELLQIAKLCDIRNEWDEREWIKTLTNCITKGQYILKIKGKEIIAFSCWLFLKDLDKIDNHYVENPEGKIAYIQAAYVKDGNNGLLKNMIREGISRHKEGTHIFFCDDRLNNEKFLMPVEKWRRNGKTD